MQILIIDDDPASTDLLKLMLQDIPAEVLTTNASSEGIVLARKHTPDIIVLNLMMPVMNGMEVCREIRKFSSRPILALSAINQPDLVASALDAGADDFIPKPVGRSMLISRVLGLLRRYPRAEGHPLLSNPGFTITNL